MASILIIEPDPTAQRLLEEFVAGLGHQIMGPQDMASGLGPDLVLLESADAAALAQAQALRTEHHALPIVCVSSAHPDQNVDELRPSAFLMKPFRGRLLDWAISEALTGESLVAA